MKKPIRVFLLALTSCAACELLGTSFSVTFREDGGLRAGDGLVRQGIRIGSVTAVEQQDNGVRVTVHVDRRHRDLLCQETRFSIEGSRADNDVDRPRLVARDHGQKCAPIREGDVIPGSEGWLADLLGDLAQAGRDALRVIERTAQDLDKELDKLESSAEAHEIRRSLRDLERDLARLTREERRDIEARKLPEIRRQAQRLRESLEKAGRSEDARRFSECFERWIEKINDEL